MDTKAFLQKAKENAENDVSILERKNSDYADSFDEPFRNFEMVEKSGLCSTEKGIAVRMTDKLQRVMNLLQKDEAAVDDETIADTLSDLRNYANILQIYLQHKQKNKKEETIYLQDNIGDAEYSQTTPGISKQYNK